MGVLQEMLREKQGCWVRSPRASFKTHPTLDFFFFLTPQQLNVGGFVSPSGYNFVGNSVEYTPGRVLSMPRGALHEKIALAASRAGMPQLMRRR
jgi:hypothetical protein